MMPTLEVLVARIRRLEDLEEIRTLVSRYAWFAAFSHADEMAKLFTCDGVLDQPGSLKVGRAEIAQYFRSLPVGYIAPVVSNYIVEFVDADTAEATCKMITNHVGSKPGLTGWYDDVYKRVGGNWLFSRRKWTTQLPLSE